MTAGSDDPASLPHLFRRGVEVLLFKRDLPIVEQLDDPVLLGRPRVLHAPHLLDYEFAHALRDLVRGGKISEDLADAARIDFADLRITRHPGTTTAERAWELRHNYTAYDAAYLALAELLDCPLLTGDAKLLGKHRTRVELVPAEG